MPPSGRKTKARTRRAPATEAPEVSDLETPETITTPSRGSRKRVRGADTTTTTSSTTRNTRRKVKDTRAPEREDTDNTEQQDQSDNETEPSTPSEQEIIQSLKVSDKHVNATEDLASELLEGQEHVPGYGKIAGRDWVYIIRKVEINIGRPESHEQRPSATESSVNESGVPSANFVIDIDLGPDRQVSRVHAIIHYDGDRREWFIIVNGRNGLRVDNNLLKRGSKAYLRNGSVIEIANTQMAFITTATEQNEGPIWDASILRQAQKSSEDEEEDDPRSNNPRNPPHPAAHGQLQDKSMYQVDYNSRQQGQQHQQRTHPHAQQANFPTMPGTPIRGQVSFQRSSPSANYNRGIMMESTETIDYASENAKDLKPPHSYAQLIGLAILNSSDNSLTLSNIYKWIMVNFSFYRFHQGGWQNSIRHNLSLNKAFEKKPRGTDEPGKGMKWIIAPAEYDNFVSQGMKGYRRPNPVAGTQSTAASPTSPLAVRTKIHENSPPPLHSHQHAYPTAQQAFTPERGSRRRVNDGPESSVGLGIEANGQGEPDFAQQTPQHGYSAAADAIGSPPPLYVTESHRAGDFDTPFPLRPSQRLAPPSTLRRPSDFITFPSSPAPFWKMSGVHSTPFKPYDLSPLKTPFPDVKRDSAGKSETSKPKKAEEAQNGDDGDDSKGRQPDATSSPLVRSSSPPVQGNVSHVLDASPSASRPTTASAKSLTQSTPIHNDKAPSDSATPPLTNGAASVGEEQIPDIPSRGSTQDASPVTQVGDPFVSNVNYITGTEYSNASGHALSKAAAPDLDTEDDNFDLFRGFESIGDFHARNRGMARSINTDPYRRDHYISR